MGTDVSSNGTDQPEGPALAGVTGVGLYEDPRPKDQVADAGFARAFGLATAVVGQLGGQLPGEAEVALIWAVLELEDFGDLAPADPESPDLAGLDVGLVVEELRQEVAALAAGSKDLATTLRYKRAEAYVREALAGVDAAGA